MNSESNLIDAVTRFKVVQDKEKVEHSIIMNLEGILDANEISNAFPDQLMVGDKGIGDMVIDVVIEALNGYAGYLRRQPDISAEYKYALSVTLIPSTSYVALHIVFDNAFVKDVGFKKWGTLEWQLYKCPKRKYFGGTLAPKADTKDWIKLKWAEYETVFDEDLDTKLVELCDMYNKRGKT